MSQCCLLHHITHKENVLIKYTEGPLGEEECKGLEGEQGCLWPCAPGWALGRVELWYPADSSTLAMGTLTLLKGSLLGPMWVFLAWSCQVHTHLHGRLIRLLKPQVLFLVAFFRQGFESCLNDCSCTVMIQHHQRFSYLSVLGSTIWYYSFSSHLDSGSSCSAYESYLHSL